MTDVRKVSPWRRFIAVLTSFMLAVMGAYAQGAVAHAEENSAIAFGPVTLTHVTETGAPCQLPDDNLSGETSFFWTFPSMPRQPTHSRGTPFPFPCLSRS